MAKIERTGQIVQILRHEDQVKFSEDRGWFLVNTEPGRRTGTGVKWIPDSTRFAWVKNFESLKERKTQNYQGIDISISIDKDDEYVDDDDVENQTMYVQATSGGKELGHVLFTMEYDSQGLVLNPQDLEVDERFRGQGIAAIMYDYVKSQGYRIRRSGQQTDAGRGFWQKHRPNQNVWESQQRLPATIEEFLDSLNPDDCGVEDIGPYRIHFEGFTSDCKSSADYRRNPEAVYQQVYQDFIQREGGQKPVMQDMVGDERFPILYSIFRRCRTVSESQQATAKQVLAYINKTHHEPFRPGEKMHAAVMAHPRWELKKVPLLNLNIPDEEYDDVEQEPESDPYNRVMVVEPGHAGEVSQYLVDKNPIVIDSDRYIIDGNHRAWAAKYLLNRDYINAWVPV